MHEIRTLLTLEMRSLYGINKFLHTRDIKERGRGYLLLGAWGILAVMVFTYVGGLVYGLSLLGLGDIVPAYLTVISSALIVAFGFFTAGERIFGQRGYDLLGAMPVKASSIVISRFLTLYAEDLVLTLAVMIPGTAVYGFCHHPGVDFYFFSLFATLVIPAIPLVAATLLGTLLKAVSSRMKNKSLAQSLLTVVLVVGVLAGSLRLGSAGESLDPEALTQLAQQIQAFMGQLYPPALWLSEAVLNGEILSFLLLLLVSFGAIAVTVYLVSANYHRVLQRLGSFSARHNYRLGSLESRSLLKALYLRELKRYFSSSIYVTNTILGPILGCMMAVALAAAGVETVQTALTLPVDMGKLLPWVLAGVFCTMTTTAVSVSMEGSAFWIIRSLPIPTKALLDSKICLNLTLMAPFYLVSLLAIFLGLRPDWMGFVWLVLIPGSVMAFSVVFGITINLKIHSFNWEKEEMVVKQSLPAMVGGFAGPLVAAVFGFVVFQIPAEYADMACLAGCMILWGATGLLYHRNNQTQLVNL